MMLGHSFDLLLVVASTLAASVAALSGFGIGSILTPILAAKIDISLAVAAISILKLWSWIALATIGCVVGTFGGKAALSSLSEELYRKVLFMLIPVLGVYMGLRLFYIKEMNAKNSVITGITR